MATPPFVVDQTTPGDADVVSLFPADNRSNMDNLNDWLAFEHDATGGHHKIPVVSEATRDGDSTWVSGSILYNTDTDQLEVVTGTGPFVFSSAAPYSEGTWTPAVAFGGASVGITYTTQVGRYVKIGSMVHLMARVVLSSKGSSVGDATITGLPFTASTVTGMVWTGNLGLEAGFDNLDVDAINPKVDIESAGTSAILRAYNAVSEVDFEIDNDDFGENTAFSIAITYQTG